MEWMDRPRRLGGYAWVAAGLLFQLGFLVTGRESPEPVVIGLLAAILVLAGVFLFDARPAVVRVVGWVTAVLLAMNFAGAVADRFGAFGPPGGALVAWGSWDAFVAYAARMLPWAPHALVVLAAVVVTVVEIVLAAWLVSGRERRWAGKAAAGLLTVYVVVMAFTVGFGAIARFGVPLLIGGALLVSAAPARRPATSPEAVPAAACPALGGLCAHRAGCCS